MVYVIGLVGFLSGFCAGQMLLLFLLRNKSNKDLKSDPRLKIYGLLNWLMAGGGAIAFVAVYGRYFG